MPNGDSKTALAAVLRRHGLSQAQVARDAGIPVPTLNQIVRGVVRPRTDNVNRILAYLRRCDAALTYEALFGSTAEAIASPEPGGAVETPAEAAVVVPAGNVVTESAA